jgi:hypothetical protein
VTTGAPIYLVSACTSGEEFVAAFRRYSDRHGVFVPIGDPLPAGSKGRFALTLKDGGVMIEGEAEIVSSAKTPSVVHGRVGMTLCFVEPDAASKTVLSELEKARLAMKPQPPSVPPRPAQLPAEPRPVPPAPLGRVDAVNALAECVAIGDVSSLAGAAVPPKASQKFVVPSIPPMGGTRSTGSLPALDRKPPTLPVPIVPPPVADTKPDLLATQRGQAPGPTRSDPLAPPPTRPPRMATPVAPMPIVTRRPSPTAPPPIVQAPVVAAPRPAVPEIEIAEPTEITAIPQAPQPALAEPESTAAKERVKRETRKTVMGVAVVPGGVMVLPAAPAIQLPSAEEADEQTSTGTPLDELVAHSNAVLGAGDVVDAPVIPPTVEEATPSGDWTMTPGAHGPTIVPRQPATPQPIANAPSQPVDADWMIALDPSRPDGWSEPSKVEKRPAGVLPPGPPMSAVASDTPLDSSHGTQPPPPPASTEPKVQIDPTLIEPLQPLPDDELAPSGPVTEPPVAYAPSPQMPAHHLAPSMDLAFPTPDPGMVPAMMHPGAVPQFPAATGSNSAYPDQAFPIDPQAMLPTQRVRAPSAEGMSMDGFGAPPRAPTSLTRAAKRKRMIVTLASAGLVVVLGIVLIVVLGRSKDKPPTVDPLVKAPVTTPDTAVKTPSPGSAEVGSPIDAGAAIAPVPAPPPTAVAQTSCVLDVITAPPGAEVFLEGNQIVGPAPTKVTLPCGVAAKISARKKLFQTATRVVKPAPNAKKPIRLVLSRITFSVKVSSVPAGATITLGTKVLGVTPTNVRLNAFEPATLTIKKDGYAPDTQKITPKQNNQTVSATLKKIAGKRGR